MNKGPHAQHQDTCRLAVLPFHVTLCFVVVRLIIIECVGSFLFSTATDKRIRRCVVQRDSLFNCEPWGYVSLSFCIMIQSVLYCYRYRKTVFLSPMLTWMQSTKDVQSRHSESGYQRHYEVV